MVLAPPLISTAEARRRRDPRSVHLGSIGPNNWLHLLAFHTRLIAGEVAPEPSPPSVASTAEASDTKTSRGLRNTACRRIRDARRQQIVNLAGSGMCVSQIAVQVNVAETTVRANRRRAVQPSRRKRRFTSDDLQRARQLHAQGRLYIEIGMELGLGRDTVKKNLAAPR